MSGSVLDHVGFFAPQADSAAEAVARLGFTVTPFTVQRNLVEGQLVPAGTGNRLVVLESGYLEILSPTGEDTPLARQLQESAARYDGVHLVTFGEHDIGAARRRLEEGGFDPDLVVDLSRAVETATGSATARFQVLRVPADRMAEARVQICRHHTPELVWQPRWMGHPNGAVALLDTMFVVEDPQHAAVRYAAFAGGEHSGSGSTWRVQLDVGALTFVDADGFVDVFPDNTVPAVPVIAAIALGVSDPAATLAWFEEHGVSTTSPWPDAIVVDPRDALGCVLAVSASDASSPWPRS